MNTLFTGVILVIVFLSGIYIFVLLTRLVKAPPCSHRHGLRPHHHHAA
jgi:hypothetical protein